MAKFDIYEAVTERIIQQLQQGVIPWQKPWTGTQHGAISGTTGKPYSLLNQMLLGKPGEYYTYSIVTRRRCPQGREITNRCVLETGQSVRYAGR